MLGRFARTMHRLGDSSSGNATILMAIGLPALVGASGLAVDTAQWYMWKRELQVAVDQAALAGAWAQTDSATAATYVTRAKQEFEANLQSTEEIASQASVKLGNWATGRNNSVIVTASASKYLPFSGYMMGKAATVSAYAQATFAEGNSYTACLIATDPDDRGSFVIEGSVTLKARCGIAALSNSDYAIIVNGENVEADVGSVVSRGGIDDYFDNKAGITVKEYFADLFDPYAQLTPPDNPTVRSYSCSDASSITTAYVSTYTEKETWTYKASKQNELGSYPSTPFSSSVIAGSKTTPTSSNFQTLSTAAGFTPPASSDSYVFTGGTAVKGNATSSGNGQSAVWTRVDTITKTYTQYKNVKKVDTPAGANLQPGTYKNGFKVTCKTTMNMGVYVIDGGDVQIDGKYIVTGSKVMFVLKGGATIKIAGTNDPATPITLNSMEQADLESLGIELDTARKLAGMLVFEAKDSKPTGAAFSQITGDKTITLGGTMYLPNQLMKFAGSVTVGSSCLMIAAGNIKIAGNVDMSSFCPETDTSSTGGVAVSNGAAQVRLVA